RRQANVSVACRRSRGRGPRYVSSASARHSGSAAADAQAAYETRLRAEIAGHRQTAILRLRVPASATELSARAGIAGEQSGRKLASGGTTTRAQDAAVQVGSLRPAFSQYARRRSQHLQTFNAISSRARCSGYFDPRRRINGEMRLPPRDRLFRLALLLLKRS